MTTGAAGYARKLDYGTAAPAYDAPALEPAAIPEAVPVPRERAVPKTRTRAAAKNTTYSISLFSIFGFVLVFALALFVVLAHVYHLGVTSETVRLNAQLAQLQEQSRRIEVEFERAIDLREIERIARDEFGMSRPDYDQVIIFQSTPQDRATVIENGEDESALRGFGSFLMSLLEYFR